MGDGDKKLCKTALQKKKHPLRIFSQGGWTKHTDFACSTN